jgi:hypothetical protein
MVNVTAEQRTEHAPRHPSRPTPLPSHRRPYGLGLDNLDESRGIEPIGIERATTLAPMLLGISVECEPSRHQAIRIVKQMAVIAQRDEHLLE